MVREGGLSTPLQDRVIFDPNNPPFVRPDTKAPVPTTLQTKPVAEQSRTGLLKGVKQTKTETSQSANEQQDISAKPTTEQPAAESLTPVESKLVTALEQQVQEGDPEPGIRQVADYKVSESATAVNGTSAPTAAESPAQPADTAIAEAAPSVSTSVDAEQNRNEVQPRDQQYRLEVDQNGQLQMKRVYIVDGKEVVDDQGATPWGEATQEHIDQLIKFYDYYRNDLHRRFPDEQNRGPRVIDTIRSYETFLTQLQTIKAARFGAPQAEVTSTVEEPPEDYLPYDDLTPEDHQAMADATRRDQEHGIDSATRLAQATESNRRTQEVLRGLPRPWVVSGAEPGGIRNANPDYPVDVARDAIGQQTEARAGSKAQPSAESSIPTPERARRLSLMEKIKTWLDPPEARMKKAMSKTMKEWERQNPDIYPKDSQNHLNWLERYVTHYKSREPVLRQQEEQIKIQYELRRVSRLYDKLNKPPDPKRATEYQTWASKKLEFMKQYKTELTRDIATLESQPAEATTETSSMDIDPEIEIMDAYDREHLVGPDEASEEQFNAYIIARRRYKEQMKPEIERRKKIREWKRQYPITNLNREQLEDWKNKYAEFLETLSQPPAPEAAQPAEAPPQPTVDDELLQGFNSSAPEGSMQWFTERAAYIEKNRPAYERNKFFEKYQKENPRKEGETEVEYTLRVAQAIREHGQRTTATTPEQKAPATTPEQERTEMIRSVIEVLTSMGYQLRQPEAAPTQPTPSSETQLSQVVEAAGLDKKQKESLIKLVALIIPILAGSMINTAAKETETAPLAQAA